MEELFAPDSAGDDDAAAAPAPAVADPVDTLVGDGAADDDLGALTSTSSGGAAAAEEDGIVAQEAGAATSSAPVVVQDDAVVDDYSMPVPVQVQEDPDRSARMVVSSPFSWVSLNPGKRCKIALSLLSLSLSFSFSSFVLSSFLLITPLKWASDASIPEPWLAPHLSGEGGVCPQAWGHRLLLGLARSE